MAGFFGISDAGKDLKKKKRVMSSPPLFFSFCSLYILLTIEETFLKSLIETLTVQKLMTFTVLNTSTNTERILCQFSRSVVSDSL